jgi:hypothetical protein
LALLAIRLDISVEGTPIGPGRSDVITLSAPDNYKGKLRHSLIFDDPRTVPKIAEWIRALDAPVAATGL